MDNDFAGLIDDALRTLWQRDPVTATFAGEGGFDDVLPRADSAAESDDERALEQLARRLAIIEIPDTAGARIDTRHVDAFCTLARSASARRARYRNPAWYTGEAAFGLISLLLRDSASIETRLRAIPGFFDDGIARLRDVAIPAAWTVRAQLELTALKRLVREALPLHPAGAGVRTGDADAIIHACDRFAAALAGVPDADAACGNDHLALIMERVHGLSTTPSSLERQAAAAFAFVQTQLEEHARKLDPSRTWREQLVRLGEIGPADADVISTYQHWNAKALVDAHDLLTPATEFGLTYAPLPAWARPVAADLYFLFYRSPAARSPGAGSMYWVTPPEGSADAIRRAHNTAAVKLVHAVHHGSIGHHTQNARARDATSRFARISGTDAASGMALLSAGTMAEGWACYAEDLMAEVPGFYTPAEDLQLVYFELRNIASCLADIRFHTGAYTLEEMRAFYRDDVAFAPGRVGPETTRNSIFPGSRLMYWTGTQDIKALRRASPLPAKRFHDTLLSYGAAPIAWIAEELAR